MPSLQSRFWRIVARMGSFYTDYMLAHSLDRLRRGSAGRFNVPAGTIVESVDAGGVPAEWISYIGQPAERVVLYLHGGGWILGWGNTHRRMVATVCRLARARALAIDYRLAPEHPFPAALEDSVAAYRWLLDCGVAPGNIAIAGDSAGGGLTISSMLSVREAGGPLPACGVGISPAVELVSQDGGDQPPSDMKDDAVLSLDTGKFMLNSYLGGQDPRNPLLSPIFADLRGLPPLLIQAGGEEILAGSAKRFAERARAAGVDATLEVWPGMWHVWHIFGASLPEARQALQHVADFVVAHVPAAPQGPVTASPSGGTVVAGN
jgi:epsilon-lactone hydrolase